ncbi:hypothetical protein Adt_00234 [Abeliophyllum distichum]|uniref:Uncharacterized protein n=1 Tax=Abeliophyllum distichum TaxID=126358 RepID=A0ABD1VPS9_9LAMI
MAVQLEFKNNHNVIKISKQKTIKLHVKDSKPLDKGGMYTGDFILYKSIFRNKQEKSHYLSYLNICSSPKCCRPKLDNTVGLEKACSTKSTTNELCNTQQMEETLSAKFGLICLFKQVSPN